MKIWTKELALYGITNLADVQLKFLAISDTMKGFESDIVSISTPLSQDYDYETDTYIEMMKQPEALEEIGCTLHYFQEKEVFNSEGVRIVSQATLKDYYGFESIYVEVVNDTNEAICGTIENMIVNGIVVDERIDEAVLVFPNTRCVIQLTMPSVGFLDDEVAQIDKIESFEYTFTVEKYEDSTEIASGDINFTVKE